MTTSRTSPPDPVVNALGFAGLLPQIAALLALLVLGPRWHDVAVIVAFAYAALILSFLGGMWWGIAAQADVRALRWLWFAAVTPSLIAFAAALPWAFGTPSPGASLIALGMAILGSLVVDRRLRAAGLAPGWWMRIRTPLSVGLAGMTLVIGILA